MRERKLIICKAEDLKCFKLNNSLFFQQDIFSVFRTFLSDITCFTSFGQIQPFQYKIWILFRFVLQFIRDIAPFSPVEQRDDGFHFKKMYMVIFMLEDIFCQYIRDIALFSLVEQRDNGFHFKKKCIRLLLCQKIFLLLLFRCYDFLTVFARVYL